MCKFNLTENDAIVRTIKTEIASTSFVKFVANKVTSILTIGMFIMILANINLFAEFKNGDGSAQNPYEIWTLEDLIKVSDFPDKHFIQKANIRKPLTEPLCTKKPFTGSYNGNGYLINLAIKGNIDSLPQIALFAYARNAVIKNIVITGFLDGVFETSGIVNKIQENVQVISCVNMTKRTIGESSAGIVGLVESETGTIVEKCINISGKVEGTITFGSGIVNATGRTPYPTNNYTIIRNNINASFVKGKININWQRTGSIVGTTYFNTKFNRISNCLATGVVDAEDMLNGIVGMEWK